MSLSFIFAMDRNRVIGLNNRLPWRLPADMAYFKKTTMGHTVLMGRKTFEFDLRGKPLAGRENVVITRDRSFMCSDCKVVHSVEEALQAVEGMDAFVIGGAEIYKAMLPYADNMYITLIDHEFVGDCHFPPIPKEEWIEASREKGITDEQNPYTYYFCKYERARA